MQQNTVVDIHIYPFDVTIADGRVLRVNATDRKVAARKAHQATGCLVRSVECIRFSARA